MNISPQDDWKILNKVLRERLYGNKDEEIEKADKEELFYENLTLKSDINNLKATIKHLEDNFMQLPYILLHTSTGKVEFISSKGIKKSFQLHNNTNEYKLLSYLMDKPLESISTIDLEKKLKPMKRSVNDLSKRRVLDTITQLRHKFEEEIFFGYGGKYALIAEPVKK